MNLNDDTRALLLNRDEVSYMMALLKAQSLAGIDSQLMAGAAPPAGRQSLVWRGLIEEPEQANKSDRVRGSLLRPALAVLHPERALVVVRDLPDTGAQLLVFLRRGEITVLHTLPRSGMHRWIELDSAEEGAQALAEWFPLEKIPGSETNFIVPVETFEKFRTAAGQGEAALQTLFYLAIPPEEKARLLRAVQNPAVSGSFALLTCAGETITSAESLAVVANDESAWAITRPEEDSAGNTYRIRRTGADLPLIFNRMFGWLMG